MKDVNKRINKWLDFNNLTQLQFAKDIGVTKGATNQWAKGYTEPTPAHEKRMALVYPDLNVYWLWGKNESMTRTNILKPVEKSHVDSIIKENMHLKNEISTKDFLIESLRDQIAMLKSALLENA
jgi:transcriptional regulator with XRE-family HTH domain